MWKQLPIKDTNCFSSHNLVTYWKCNWVVYKKWWYMYRNYTCLKLFSVTYSHNIFPEIRHIIWFKLKKVESCFDIVFYGWNNFVQYFMLPLLLLPSPRLWRCHQNVVGTELPILFDEHMQRPLLDLLGFHNWTKWDIRYRYDLYWYNCILIVKT